MNTRKPTTMKTILLSCLLFVMVGCVNAQFGVRIKCYGQIFDQCFLYRVEFTKDDFVSYDYIVDSSLNTISFKNLDSAKAFAKQFDTYGKCYQWNARMEAFYNAKELARRKKIDSLYIIKIY